MFPLQIARSRRARLTSVVLIALAQSGVCNADSVAAAHNSQNLTVMNNSIKAESFALSQVQLLDSAFRDAMERNATYLLAINPDRLLHNTRKYAGLQPKAPLYGGWEARGIAGRTLDDYRPGEQQSEVDHAQKGENSEAAEWHGRKFRHTVNSGWFSFEQKVSPDAPVELRVTYWGGAIGAQLRYDGGWTTHRVAKFESGQTGRVFRHRLRRAAAVNARQKTGHGALSGAIRQFRWRRFRRQNAAAQIDKFGDTCAGINYAPFCTNYRWFDLTNKKERETFGFALFLLRRPACSGCANFCHSASGNTGDASSRSPFSCRCDISRKTPPLQSRPEFELCHLF